MNQTAGRETWHDGSPSEHGLEALRESVAFRGPADPLADHDHTNDHLALIYGSREEQFAATVPYIRQGLERGERCVYITHENSRDDVIEAMRNRGVDVEGALESGALSIFDERQTYLRNGSFDPEDTLVFLDAAIAEAAAEYDGFRVTGEMSFILDDDSDVDALMTCESKANYLFEDVDGMALCQYNRERFSPAVIRDVINTHPHLVHENRICHNSYYTPPSEFLGPQRPAREVERMLGTLREQTDAKTELQTNQRFLQESYAITSDPDRSFEAKLEQLLELGCERFDLDIGSLTHRADGDEAFEIETIVGTDDGNVDDGEYRAPAEGISTIQPSDGCFCHRAATSDGPVCVEDVRTVGWDDDPIHEQYGLSSYFGTAVTVDSDRYGTLWFGSTTAREAEFTDTERAYLELIEQWVSYELDRRRYERKLERTINQLQQSNERLKQFAYAASHDLQEPLRMVSSYLQLLERRYADDLDETAKEYIDFAVDGADRMRAMVDDLLAYARVERADGSFEPVDCDAVLERVREDLRVRTEETDADLAVESLPTVRGDREQLEQLFANLVSNAIKYSGDEPPAIEITADERPDRWEFAVADDGIGIDPEKTDRIFEVFKRLHGRNEHDGTGIGLSICQEIVENHGGEIRVDSEPGEGSTFTVTLPKRPQE